MKKIIAVVAIILVLGGILYTQRHTLKNMMMGGSNSYTMKPSPSIVPSVVVSSDNIYLTKTDPKKGKYMTDFSGRTLYTFDKDTTGVSACYGQCATLWPAYSSGATAQKMFPSGISVITRTDGTKQFSYQGKPLYYYAQDQNAGDMNGDGIGGVWHIVSF